MPDQTAVVTGASQGIGRSTAIRLARDFPRIVLVARDRSRLEETASEVKAAGAEALARAYVDFATRHPALLQLMFAAKRGPGAARMRELNEKAFATPIALLARARGSGEIVGDQDRINMAVLALVQGLAVIAADGMNGELPMDDVVTGAATTLVEGLAPRERPAAR